MQSSANDPHLSPAILPVSFISSTPCKCHSRHSEVHLHGAPCFCRKNGPCSARQTTLIRHQQPAILPVSCVSLNRHTDARLHAWLLSHSTPCYIGKNSRCSALQKTLTCHNHAFESAATTPNCPVARDESSLMSELSSQPLESTLQPVPYITVEPHLS